MFRTLLAAALSLMVFSTSARADIVIEGFESGNLSQYALFGSQGMGAALVDTIYAHDGKYGLGMGSDEYWYLRTDAGATLSRGDSFFVWVRLTDGSTSNGGQTYFGFGSSATNTYAAVLAPNAGSMQIQEDNPTARLFNSIASVSQTFVANSWYKVGVNWTTSGQITVNLFGSDGTTLINTVSVTNNDISTGGIGFRVFHDEGGGTSPNNMFDTVTKISAVPAPPAVVLVGLGAGCVAVRRYVVRRATA
jgi:hypothetical protein